MSHLMKSLFFVSYHCRSSNGISTFGSKRMHFLSRGLKHSICCLQTWRSRGWERNHARTMAYHAAIGVASRGPLGEEADGLATNSSYTKNALLERGSILGERKKESAGIDVYVCMQVCRWYAECFVADRLLSPSFFLFLRDFATLRVFISFHLQSKLCV